MNTISTRYRNFLFVCLIFSAFEIRGQYEVNPLVPVTNDGYTMTVAKFVKIPDDGAARPRINSFTFFEERIFVTTELGGKIYEIIRNGNDYQPVLFLDVKAAILQNTGRHLDETDGWHNGLRCVAFHPNFLNNGKFYTSLMEERPVTLENHHYISDVTNAIPYDGVLIEWMYNHTNGSVNTDSYREVFRVGMPVFDHTIKDIAFNRYAQPGDEDYGLLYITHGDGSELSAAVGGGQNNDALGKVLRINPLQSGSDTYSIPQSNPFVNDDQWLDEIYSLGHRNPHTICFGKDASGDVHIIVGEAGRDNMEEVNIIKKGGNYGWSQRDGTYVHLPQGGLQTGIAALPANDAINRFIYPAAQFSKVGAKGLGFASQAIAGGYVYTDHSTGKKLYLCADFAKSGRVFHVDMEELVNAKTQLNPDDPNLNHPSNLTQAHMGELNVLFDHDKNANTPAIVKASMKDIIDDEPNYDPFLGGRADLRFGQDKNEDIYISSKRNGWVYKVLSIDAPPPVGIDKNREQLVSVFPNPVSRTTVLKVEIAASSAQGNNVTLNDIYGREYFNSVMAVDKEKWEIDLSVLSLAPGYYIVRISSATGNRSYPIIVK